MKQVYYVLLSLLLKYHYCIITVAIVVKTDTRDTATRAVKSRTKNDLIPTTNDKLSRVYLPPPPPTAKAISVNEEDQESECDTEFIANNNIPQICLLPPFQKPHFNIPEQESPLLAALILGQSLGLHHSKIHGYNHPEHLPLNPYLALLLSHYGKYAPIHGTGRGLYGYTASNNYHNNQPFGAYKVI